MNRELSCSVCGRRSAGTVFNQHSVNGVRPKILGSKYTIPQRDTVAGEATARSCTSNIRVITWTQGKDMMIKIPTIKEHY